MWIVYWTEHKPTLFKDKDGKVIPFIHDEYHITSEDAAKILYEERIKLETTYTAGYAKIVESTEPHHVNP